MYTSSLNLQKNIFHPQITQATQIFLFIPQSLHSYTVNVTTFVASTYSFCFLFTSVIKSLNGCERVPRLYIERIKVTLSSCRGATFTDSCVVILKGSVNEGIIADARIRSVYRLHMSRPTRCFLPRTRLLFGK